MLTTIALAPVHLDWNKTISHSSSSLRGLSIAPGGQVWVGGTHGTILRSSDRGHTWDADTVSGAGSFDFRGVAGVDERTAYAAVSSQDTARIYYTRDAGASWSLQYQDQRPGVFLDGLACWNAQRCIAFGDPLNGQFLVLKTDNGGGSWARVTGPAAPSAMPGEAAFAASNSSLIVGSGGRAWIATGGGPVTRVWRSSDFGSTWRVATTPVAAGKSSAGIFSVAFCGDQHGVVVGGDYRTPEATGAHVAVSEDGGEHWVAADSDHVTPYLSGVTCAPDGTNRAFVAVGPTGTFGSTDGFHWGRLNGQGYNAVAASGDTLIAVGGDGAVGWGVLHR